MNRITRCCQTLANIYEAHPSLWIQGVFWLEDRCCMVSGLQALYYGRAIAGICLGRPENQDARVEEILGPVAKALNPNSSNIVGPLLRFNDARERTLREVIDFLRSVKDS